MSFKYILTTSSFFKEGPCGRVSHAKGFLEGLSLNEHFVTLISDSGAEDFITKNNFIKIKSIESFLLLYSFVEIVKSIVNKERVVIRWRPILPYIYLPLMIFYNDITYEVNSITGLKNNNSLIRNIVKGSIVLSTRFSKVIVVSENSKKQIISISKNAKSIHVMPNGVSTQNFVNFIPKIDKAMPVNLVYFGRKQGYYEWQNIYNICKENANINFHVFGFKDDLGLKNVRFYGEFNHKSLIKKLKSISNPILIIHPGDSDIAKSGSPMKLFEYAYLSIPVIVGDSLLEISKDFPEFIFYESGNKLSLNHTIQNTIANYNDIYTNFNHLKDTVITKYSWEAIIKKWLDTEVK